MARLKGRVWNGMPATDFLLIRLDGEDGEPAWTLREAAARVSKKIGVPVSEAIVSAWGKAQRAERRNAANVEMMIEATAARLAEHAASGLSLDDMVTARNSLSSPTAASLPPDRGRRGFNDVEREVGDRVGMAGRRRAGVVVEHREAAADEGFPGDGVDAAGLGVGLVGIQGGVHDGDLGFGIRDSGFGMGGADRLSQIAHRKSLRRQAFAFSSFSSWRPASM